MMHLGILKYFLLPLQFYSTKSVEVEWQVNKSLSGKSIFFYSTLEYNMMVSKSTYFERPNFLSQLDIFQTNLKIDGFYIFLTNKSTNIMYISKGGLDKIDIFVYN